MKKLTKKAAFKYLLEGGIDCPYCKGHDTMRHDETDLENGCLVYSCCKCKREVTEYYKVYGVSGDDTQAGDPFVLYKFSFKESEPTEYELQVGEGEIEVLFHRIVYWWRDDYEPEDEGFIEERIKDMILDGYNQGELQHIDRQDKQHSGWWRIQK